MGVSSPETSIMRSEENRVVSLFIRKLKCLRRRRGDNDRLQWTLEIKSWTDTFTHRLCKTLSLSFHTPQSWHETEFRRENSIKRSFCTDCYCSAVLVGARYWYASWVRRATMSGGKHMNIPIWPQCTLFCITLVGIRVSKAFKKKNKKKTSITWATSLQELAVM